MKKLAVVASGWHFPLHFYKKIAEQKIPEGWQVELYCISHRDPSYAVTEKKDTLPNLGYDRRGLYDRIMYDKLATVEDMERLGWKYSLEPNTIGDWGNSNQWLEKHNFKDYDMFLFTHDDNFILNNELFTDLLESGDWLVLTNSEGTPPGSVRGSFEFFTREIMEKIGGKFDLSMTTLTREGKTTAGDSLDELGNWNTTVTPLSDFIEANNLQSRIVALSPYYRISAYCLEGERGYMHKTYELNTASEEKGFDFVEKAYQDGGLDARARGVKDVATISFNSKKPSTLRLLRMKLGALKGRLVKIFR